MNRLLFATCLLALAGCASLNAQHYREARVATDDPWDSSGIVPTAQSIRDALYDDVHRLDADRCPFLIATCADANRGRTRTRLEVDDVQCRAVETDEERCSFRLVETVPGRPPARSRCSARFEIVGTSHDPMRWAVKFDWGDENPLMTCRRLP